VGIFPKTRLQAVVVFSLGWLLLLAAPCNAGPSDPFWGQDKAMHFSACLLIAADTYSASSLAARGQTTRVATGASVAIAAGAAKEVYDRYSGGDASLRDLTWDVVGATTGAVLSWLIDRYLF
jgi:putative lipoprotein